MELLQSLPEARDALYGSDFKKIYDAITDSINDGDDHAMLHYQYREPSDALMDKLQVLRDKGYYISKDLMNNKYVDKIKCWHLLICWCGKECTPIAPCRD